MATSNKHAGTDKKAVANDASLLAGMVLTPLYKNPQMVDQLVKVMASANDPPNALAHSLFSMISQARNAIMQAKIPVSGKAWLADGGAIDKVIIDVGGLLASNGAHQFVDKRFGIQTKQDLIKIMHQEETSAGGQGDPNQQEPDQDQNGGPSDGDADNQDGQPDQGGLAAPAGPPQAGDDSNE